MSHVSPREYEQKRQASWVREGQAVRPEVIETDPTIRKLYGPDGKVLRTYSDRPPIGFHSALRDES